MSSTSAGRAAYRAPSQAAEAFYELPRGVRGLVAESAGAVLLETSRRGAAEARSYVFLDPVRVSAVHALGEVPALFEAIEAARLEGLYAAGFLGYECGYHFEPSALAVGEQVSGDALPMAWFGFYRDPLIFNHGTGLFNREVRLPQMWEERTLELGAEPELEITGSAYAEQVERVKRLIEAGDTYQANLTTRVRIAVPEDVPAMFAHMMRAQPVEFGAFLNLGTSQILSASPELFFCRDGDEILMRPMKGTTGRGLTTAEDEERALWLAADEKNRSENVMIVDLLRNDLGRVCRMGGVRAEEMFTVERYPTVLQMVSTVRGVLRPGVDLYDLFRAVFPSGSIVGAPKIRAMQILRSIKRRDRGVYTGSIGFIAPGAQATFSVAIRTMVVEGGRAEMGVGSGVVYDSDAETEYEECRSKAGFLAADTSDFQLIETMLWDGDYVFLDEHMERLAGSAEYFDFAVDFERVQAALMGEARRFPVGCRSRVRLLVDRRGSIEVGSIEVVVEEAAPVAVLLAEGRVSSGNVFLRHKTTRRGVYDSGYADAQRQGYVDAIFRNECDEVTEGAIYNVVVVRAGVWRTPPLSAGVLPGIYRAHVIKSRGVLEETITTADLLAADEVYLCNSVRGLRRVSRIDPAAR